MGNKILTDKQLHDLRGDIKAGRVMIVDKAHYYQLEAQAKSQPALLARLKAARCPYCDMACGETGSDLRHCRWCDEAKVIIASAEDKT